MESAALPRRATLPCILYEDFFLFLFLVRDRDLKDGRQLRINTKIAKLDVLFAVLVEMFPLWFLQGYRGGKKASS